MPKTRIGIVYADTQPAFQTTVPLRVFSNQIAECGFSLCFARDLDAPALQQCEIICLVYGDRGKLIRLNGSADGEQLILEALAKYKSRGHKIIILDNQDTTGKIRREYVRLVDVYGKAQLLKDRTFYARSLHGKVYYKDYYYRNFGVEEPGSGWSEKRSI